MGNIGLSISCGLLMWIGGFGIGMSVGASKVQTEAIDHGYAEYNSQTGDWQWKESDAPSNAEPSP